MEECDQILSKDNADTDKMLSTCDEMLSLAVTEVRRILNDRPLFSEANRGLSPMSR